MTIRGAGLAAASAGKLPPRVTTVAALSPSAWPRRSRSLHNVRVRNAATSHFNQALAPNAEAVRDLDGAELDQVLEVHCDVHPGETAYAIVVANQYWDTTDHRGAFRLAVPAGSYELEAWHPILGSKRMRAETHDGDEYGERISFDPGDIRAVGPALDPP